MHKVYALLRQGEGWLHHTLYNDHVNVYMPHVPVVWGGKEQNRKKFVLTDFSSPKLWER